MAVCLDEIKTIEASEVRGRLVSVKRLAIVSGLADTDYKVLFSALDEVGVPQDRATLDGAPDLYLVERNPKLVGENIVHVELLYQAFFVSDDILLSDPPYNVLEGGQRTSIQQLETNKDENGDKIELSHTYPADDPNYPGETETQGGSIAVFLPQKTFNLKFRRSTSTPWVMSDQLIGRINRNVWRGEPKWTWMCTAVDWKLHRVDGGVQYEFELEFQHNGDTWNPTAVFIDPRTDAPPPDLVDGIGYKTFRIHKEVDFDQILGFPVTGVST